MAGLETTIPRGVLGAPVKVREIGIDDLKFALRQGLSDFQAMPSHVVFVSFIYPVLGIVLASFAFGNDVLPLLFPLASGFALIGPFAALGLYELSRRREAGLDTSWRRAFDVVQSPAIGSIVALGAMLLVIFVLWLFTARALYGWFVGPMAPTTIGGFVSRVLFTPEGWTLIVVGNALGLLFAIVTFSISVVSFPLLLDRNVGAGAAIGASIRAVRTSPRTMAVWGLIIAVALALGSIPVFVGLAIVLPILGHASWHLYRDVVGP